MDTLNTPAINLEEIKEQFHSTRKGSTLSLSKVEVQNAGNANSPVFALGTIGIDYGSKKRKRAFKQILGGNLYDTRKLLEYLKQEEITPDTLIWTLNQNSLPIYIILPDGAFASDTVKRLMDIFQKQLNGDVELVSVAGKIKGKAKLLSGMEVPVIVPDPAGIYSWSTDEMKLKVGSSCVSSC